MAEPARYLALMVLLAATSVASLAQGDGATPAIPPVERVETHLSQGREYLRSLPEGTRITVTKADGASFTMQLHEGALHAELPASELTPQGVVITPLGYRLYVDPVFRGAFCVEAPNGKRSLVMPGNQQAVIFEDDAGRWHNDSIQLVLRLPDATRIDFFDGYKAIEVLTLGGERFALTLADGEWSQKPPIPSPPLIPERRAYYLAGDGNDWRRPRYEDHVVFGWNWYPLALEIERVIKDLERQPRLNDLRLYFVELGQPQPAPEMGGILLARRLALSGGDLLTFEPPGDAPHPVYIFPGNVEPDYVSPPPMRRGPRLDLRVDPAR